MTIELSRLELQILIKALKGMSPTDKTDEMILFMLYSRFERKLTEDEKI